MTNLDKNKLWREMLGSLRLSVSPAIYSTWLSQTSLIDIKKTNGRFNAKIGCASSFIKTTLETRYFGLIQDSLSESLDAPVNINFVVKQQSKLSSKEDSFATPLFEKNDINQRRIEKAASLNIRAGFTFSNFAVSGSNQMAHAAAEAVASRPGSAYNPLFIWGGVGVGKTHLMHAVGHKLIEKNINTKIVVCTGEDFTNDIVEGIRNKTTQSFRNKYRRLDALFIDDIQFIAGKDAVQDEFFHTFNAVTGAGGQIILTSDKPPSDIPRLEERLKSRFEAGLIVDIGQPDFELRCAITQIKASEKGISLPTEIIHLIAGNIDTARKIEGFLIRLSSEVNLKHAELTEDFVKNLLGKKDSGIDTKIKSPDEVIEAVCNHFSISKRAMTGKARARMIARPRQVLMYILRTELGLPLEEIGRILGGRDHSTVIHAVDKITNLASIDKQIREDILQIKNIF